MKNIKIIPTIFPISKDFAVVNYISLGSKRGQKTAPTTDTANPTYLSSADSRETPDENSTRLKHIYGSLRHYWK